MVIVIPYEWVQHAYLITLFIILYALSGFFIWIGWDFGRFRDSISIIFVIVGIIIFSIPTIMIMFVTGVIVVK